MKARKIISLLLAGILCLSAVGCGKDEQTDAVVPDAYVYVPTYIELPSENNNYSNITAIGSKLYYTGYVFDEAAGIGQNKLYSMDVAAEGAVPAEIPFTVAQTDSVMCMIPDAEENIYLISQQMPEFTGEGNVDWQEQQKRAIFKITKIASDGTEVYTSDISEYVKKDENNAYVQRATIDKAGNLYITNGNSYIWIFDKDGKFLFDISLSNWVDSMGSSQEGDVYFMQYGANGPELMKIDIASKSTGAALTGLPNNSYNSSIQPGIGSGILLKGETALYNYDIEKQQSEEVLNWIDSDINGNYVQFVTALPDGRILLYYRNWNNDESEVVLLTKTEASQIQEKEMLTLGVFYMDSELQEAVVNFNKNNDAYRIKVKSYSENMGTTETAYQDAINKMNNELITGTAPDMIDISSAANVDQLVSKGIIEDLYPYLEKSTVVKKEDIIDSVLKVYTINDRLIAIPSKFYVSTWVGKTSVVGDRIGWTLDEMLEIVAKQPEGTKVLQYGTKNSMLSNALVFNQEAFIDWQTGTCTFNTEEFIKVLEFANTLPEEVDYQQEQDNTAELLNSGKLLLMEQFLDSVRSYQMMQMTFGEPVTSVGYPSESREGVAMNGYNTVAISAKSKNKEGAWAFLESFLTEDYQIKNDKWNYNGIPSLKKAMDDMFAKNMVAEYQKDENGELVLDEEGNPIEYSTSSVSMGPNLTFEMFAATQEDVDGMKAIIDSATQMFKYDSSLINIVIEEAEPFFKGQKSAKEAAEIIQSRVQIYVDENR